MLKILAKIPTFNVFNIKVCSVSNIELGKNNMVEFGLGNPIYNLVHKFYIFMEITYLRVKLFLLCSK